MEGADMEMDSPTVTLTDEAGRSLTCYLEGAFEVEGQKYGLLYPVDSPVQIFAWELEEDAEEEVLKDVEEAEIDEVFATAQAVLAEQNLKLKRTALSLTVEGDLPEVVEDEILTLEIEEGEETMSEEFQFLTSFYQKEQEYAAYTPLDPLLLIARMDANNRPELLSPEEFQRIQPVLEDQLFDELE